MAVTSHTDVIVSEDHFYGGVFEELEQQVEAIVNGSGGAILVRDERIKGDYGYDSFFARIADMVERRVVDTVSDGTATQAVEKEYVSVKLNRRTQVEWTWDAFKKKNLDPAAFSFALGREFQRRKLQEMLNSGLVSVATALESQTALTKDVTGETTKTVTHDYLNDALALRGDKASEIIAVAIHSKPYYDLVGQAISDKVPANVGGMAIMEGSVGLFGRRALISDSSGLIDLNGSLTDTYNTLGLVQGALELLQSEPESIIGLDLVTGKHNLIYRFQAEWSYNIRVKGFQWDVTNGGANPDASTLATTTNWDQIDTDDKTLAGVLLVSQ